MNVMLVHKLSWGSINGTYESGNISVFGYWKYTWVYLLLPPGYVFVLIGTETMYMLYSVLGFCKTWFSKIGI